MINLVIDGQEVQVNEGASLLEAAESTGIKIPTLCTIRRYLLMEPADFVW